MADNNQIIVRRAMLGSELRERGLHGFGVPVDRDPENSLLWLWAANSAPKWIKRIFSLASEVKEVEREIALRWNRRF